MKMDELESKQKTPLVIRSSCLANCGIREINVICSFTLIPKLHELNTSESAFKFSRKDILDAVHTKRKLYTEVKAKYLIKTVF